MARPDGRHDQDPLQFSLNVPVPGRVAAIASELRPALSAFESIRDRHTLVLKRLEEGDPDGLETRVRQALAGAPACEARIAGIGAFEDPPAGSAPVVYLAVESPGLVQIHERLCDRFAPAMGIEGEHYLPHVTLARGGGDAATAAVERLLETEVEPVTWTVGELVFWDARYGEATGRVSLPA